MRGCIHNLNRSYYHGKDNWKAGPECTGLENYLECSRWKNPEKVCSGEC